MGLFDKFRKKVRDAASDIDSESISAEDGTQEAIDALQKHGEIEIENPMEPEYDDDWEDIDDDEDLNLPSTMKNTLFLPNFQGKKRNYLLNKRKRKQQKRKLLKKN